MSSLASSRQHKPRELKHHECHCVVHMDWTRRVVLKVKRNGSVFVFNEPTATAEEEYLHNGIQPKVAELLLGCCSVEVDTIIAQVVE